MPIPAFDFTFSASDLTRGFWFQTPVGFRITGLRVPDEFGHGLQNVEVFRLAGPPPIWPESASGGRVFYVTGIPSSQVIPTNLEFNAGDYVGILGAAGDAGIMHNSYAAVSTFASNVLGNPVTLYRFLTQANLVSSGGDVSYSTEDFSLARIEVYVEPSAPPLEITLTPKTAENPLGTPHTVTATVLRAGVPVANELVRFRVVSGPNAGVTGIAMTDVTGRAQFTYVGTSTTGTDTIQACVLDEICDTAVKTWVNAPPDCDHARPDVDELWPPNHRMVEIHINGVVDPDGDPVSITILRITQDEPINGLGDGDTSPDGAGVGTPTARVRAERAGTGNGRVYEVTFTASDGKGGDCIGRVRVCAPHDRSAGHSCTDDGQLFDSTGAAPRASRPGAPSTGAQ